MAKHGPEKLGSLIHRMAATAVHRQEQDKY